MAAEIRCYFGEDLGRLTLPQMMARQALLYTDSSVTATRSTGLARGEAMATNARAMLSKSGRARMPLGEVIGVL